MLGPPWRAAKIVALSRHYVARSERFELPTPRFEVWCSIQLSYERARAHHSGFGANVTCVGRVL